MLEAAISLRNTPFRMHGRDRSGLDCVGLVWLIRKIANRPTIDFHDYPNRVNSAMSFRRLNLLARRVSKDESVAGDAVLMSFGDQSTHLGIILEDGRIAHADRHRGVVIYDLNRCRVVAYYKLPEA